MKQLIKKLLTHPLIYPLLTSMTRSHARIVMYHGVSPLDPITPQILEEHIKLFQEYYTIIPLGELLEKQKQPHKRPLLALTFDDGLKNNAVYATSILEKYHVPATYFICSKLLDGQSLLWNHELRIRLESLSATQRSEIMQTTAAIAAADIRAAIENLKSEPMQICMQRLDHARRLTTDLVLSEEQKTRYQLMSAQELATLPQCIELGSHTRTHPILDKIPEDQLIEEIAGSKQDLESLTGRSIESFCYPNGNHDDVVSNLVAQHYQTAVTTEPGLAKKTLKRNQLPRVHALVKSYEMLFSLIHPMT